ncbi:MAG: GNAT family N-acetyltransferase [Spirochaetaceae bacterium]
MIEYKTEIDNSEWDILVDLYDETNMFLGLGRNRDTDKIRRAYEKSYRYVIAWDSNKIIGAGRMISDGECYAWIHDVAVLSSYRKQGIGRGILDKLMEGNEGLLIGLTSSFEAIDFYSKLGFNKHKTAMAKYPGRSDYLEY